MNHPAAPDNRPAGPNSVGPGHQNRSLVLLLAVLALVTLTTAGLALLPHRTVAGTPAAVLGTPGVGAPLTELSVEQSALVRRLPVGLVNERSCRPMAGSRALLAAIACSLQAGPAEITLYATDYRSDAELADDLKHEALGDEPSGPCGNGREHVQSTWTAGDGTAGGPLHCGGLSEALPWHYIAMEYPTSAGGPVQLFFQVSPPSSVDPNGSDERSSSLVSWWRRWITQSGSLRH